MIKEKEKTTQDIIRKYNVLKILLSIVISIVIIVAVVFMISSEPVEAMKKFLLGPIDSKRHIANVLENSIPFLFTGTAVCLMFSAGDITLSAEGSVYFGGFIASVVVISLGISSKVGLLAALLIAFISGAIIAVIPVYLNKKYKIDSFVFSLLFNFVLLYLGNYVLNYKLKDVSYVGIASTPFPEGTMFSPLVANTKFNVGFVIGVVVAVLAWLFLYKTKWGYKARLVGSNPKFAQNLGINALKISLLVAILGGGISALGGAVEMLGKYPRFMWTALPGYGWDGFMVSTLALANPLYVPLASIFLGYIRTGAQIMNLYTDVPLELISVVQSIIILLIASKAMLKKYQQREIAEQSKINAEKSDQ